MLSGQMLAYERYAFRDSWRDPDAMFPEFMKALRRYDSAYDLVWDRQLEQWACITWMTEFNYRGSHHPQIVAMLEDEAGVPMEPTLKFIDWLHETDWHNKSKSVAEHLDKMDREFDYRMELAEQRYKERFREHCNDDNRYTFDQPKSISLSFSDSLMRFGFASLRTVRSRQEALAASHAGSAAEVPNATVAVNAVTTTGGKPCQPSQ